MTDIINFIPEKYRGLALVLIALSPYITRAFYALVNGRGLKGTLAAIWLGTNTPSNPPQTSPPSGSGGTFAGGTAALLVALGAASLLFTGCASVTPGQSAVVVRAEQSISVANATFDSAVHIDDADRALFAAKVPAFHSFCEWLRQPVTIWPLTNSLPRGLAIVNSADMVKNSYKTTRSTNDYAALISALAVVETATVQAQQLIVTATAK